MKEGVGLRFFVVRMIFIGGGFLGLFFLVKPFWPLSSLLLPAWGNSLVFTVMIFCLAIILYGLAGVLGEIWVWAWMLWQKAKIRLARGQKLIGS